MRKSIVYLSVMVLGALVLLPLTACDQAKEAAKSASDSAREAVGEAVDEAVEKAGEGTAAPAEGEEAKGGEGEGEAGEEDAECTDAMMHSGECETEAQARGKETPRWRDENDAGDDPMNAGCHWGYAPGTGCSQGKFFVQGDTCLSGKLREWYDTTCHAENADYNYYDCNELCIEEGIGTGGKCVAVDNACGRGLPSARCECFGVT